jgi:hypothetical protein
MGLDHFALDEFAGWLRIRYALARRNADSTQLEWRSALLRDASSSLS